MVAHHALTKRVRHWKYFTKRFLLIFLIAGYALIGCADNYPRGHDEKKSIKEHLVGLLQSSQIDFSNSLYDALPACLAA